MGKFTTYMFVMAGFFLVFYYLGISDNTWTSGLLTLLFNPSGAASTLGASGKLAILAPLLTGALAYGTVAIVTRQYFSESLVLVSFMPTLVAFLFDFIKLFVIVNGFNTIVALLIFAPMIIVYVLTIIEWWRGVPT